MSSEYIVHGETSHSLAERSECKVCQEIIKWFNSPEIQKEVKKIIKEAESDKKLG